MASSHETIIAQAAPSTPATSYDIGEMLPDKFHLDMRGKHFDVTREQLFSLPESIVYSLSSGFGYNDQASGGQDNSDVTIVDFSPDCFQYALTIVNEAERGLQPPIIPVSSFREFNGFVDPTSFDGSSDAAPAGEPSFLLQPTVVPDILVRRPAIVVLKEDLEYFCLADEANLAHEELMAVKVLAGEKLAMDRHIFEGRVTGPKEEAPGSPGYHLMRMLVLSGYSENEVWGFREREPRKTLVTSVQLNRLRLPESADDVQTIQAIQKLLLFWKKPARKCWWDKFRLEDPSVAPATIHVRKVWTLELSIIGVD